VSSSRYLPVCFLSLALLLLAGCGSDVVGPVLGPPPPPPSTEPDNCKAVNVTSPAQPAPTPNLALPAFTGTVMAGNIPVMDAQVALYTASAAGNGSPAKPLLPDSLSTDPNGAFAFPAGLSCPFSNTVIYAVARAGQTVPSVATINPASELVAILGTCDSIQSGDAFTVNEATTVAAAYAMAQFFGPLDSSLGATATNSSGIALAAATAANLADVHTGALPGAAFPSTGTAPIARIDSLANVLHACIVSSGPQSSPCRQLFTAAYGTAGPPKGETAGETFSAALSVARAPATNVAQIFTLSQGSTAFQPALATAPADWTLAVNFKGGGLSAPSALSIDSTGRLWVANYFSSASLFTNTGVPVFNNGITGLPLENSFGGAVNVDDAFWIANEESPGSVNNGLGSVSVLSPTGSFDGHYLSGGINFPLAVAFDTSGVAWVVDYGDSSLTLLDPSGNPLSGTSGYAAKNLVFPVAVATDAKCNAYIANQASNAVTLVLADGSAFTDFAVGEAPSGIAVDAGGNIWSSNYYGDSIGLVTVDGKVLSGGGITGGGLDHPQGIAPDGLGNVWVANYRAPGISELAAATASTPGAILSPATGFAPDSGLSEAFGLAIDAGGNLWTTSFGSDTLTEFVGLAAPVKTPLLGPVRVP
jgi:sugar lactone lactonase YvrE